MNAQERALTKAKEKVEMLLWEKAAGVAIAEITGTLRISKPLAISALKAIGTVEQNGLWAVVDDEPAQVAPGAKAEIEQSVEPSGISGELVEPLSNPYELPEPETVKVIHAEPDWANAPEGATHYLDCIDELIWIKVDGDSIFSLTRGGAWRKSVVAASEALKDPDYKPIPRSDRDQPIHENPIAQSFYQETKSDYATVLDVMLTKVLNAIKSNGGASIERICELVDVFPDDVPDCVYILMDHGQLVSRPLYFTTVYEVAA